MLTRKNQWVIQETKQPEDYLTVEQFKKYFPKPIFNLNGIGKTLISVLSTLKKTLFQERWNKEKINACYGLLDGLLFAYNIKDAIWYGLAITLPGGSWHKISGTAIIIGNSGFANCVDNSDTTVSFYGLNYNQGDVDYFGRYQKGILYGDNYKKCGQM